MKFVNIRIWLFLFGIIFVIAAYLFQQSRTNQKQLHQQAMKSIENTRINFQEALENYHLQLDSFLRRRLYSLSEIGGAQTARDMTGVFDKVDRFPIQQIRLISHRDSLSKYTQSKKFQIISLDSSFILETDYIFNLDVNYPEKKDHLPKLLDMLEKQANWKFLRDNLDAESPVYFGITHPISFYELMKYNLNNKFFDKTYVVDEKGMILYPKAQQGLMLFEPTDLYSNATDPEGARLMKLGNRNIRLNINAVDHEVFIAPVYLGDKYLYLAGAKELNRFQKVALRIDYSLLSAFVISLLLIFTSIPIFSMFKLDVGDILSKNKIFGLGLSVILLSLILGFSVAFIRNSTNKEDHRNELKLIDRSYLRNINKFDFHLKEFPYQRKVISNNVSPLFIHHSVPENQGFDKELSLTQMYFKKIGFSSSNLTYDTLVSLHQNVNEFLEFDQNLLVTRMYFPKIGSSSLDLQFDNLKFLSLANRDYAQYILKESNSPRFISAHYSLATGELEGVISHKNKEKQGKAITFKLSDIAKNESRSKRFFVFKPNGKILFKSEKVTIPVSYLQQAVEDLKWVEISSLINNNKNISTDVQWEIPLYVNGYEYLGMLKKLTLGGYDEELWMLYLVDENLGHIRSSLISLESVIFIIGYITLLVFLALLTSIANKKSIYLNTSTFSYFWYAPSANKRKQFLLLNILILFEIVCLIILYYFIPINIFILFLWCCFFAIQTSVLRFLLLHPDKEGPYDMDEINYLVVIAMVWLLFAALLLYTVYISTVGVLAKIITGSVIVIWGIIIRYSYHNMSNKKLPKFDPLSIPDYKFQWQNSTHQKMTKMWDKITQSTAPIRIYALSFVLWSIMIGFLPGYMLPREVHSHESQIWKALQTETPLISKSNTALSSSFQYLIENYELVRRYAFTQLSDQHDQAISDFINLNQAVLYDTFSEPKTRNYAAILVFSLLLLLVFWLLFRLIMYFSHRIFLTEFLYNFDKSVSPLHSIKARNNFIVCPDSQKAKEWIFAHVDLKGIEPTVLDCANLKSTSGQEGEDLPSTPGQVFIVENIHLNAHKPDFIPFLSGIMEIATNVDYIFIISGIPFKELEKTMSKAEALHFSEIFSSFIFHTVPIHYSMSVNKISFHKSKPNLQELKFLKIINQEINYGPNSEQICQLINEELEGDNSHSELKQDKFEKCILTIQRYNKAYYSNIWQELSFKEQKLVYYFAKEGFINFRNKDALTALIEKGIFKLDTEKNKLTLFSLGFQNFVHQHITLEIKEAFKKDEREYGNAGNIQTAAISFVFISIAVVSYYDPNILNKTSAYVSAVIGLMGSIYSLLSGGVSSLFGKAKLKE